MITRQIAKFAAVPALLLLAACGQDSATQSDAAADGTDGAEMSETATSGNRDWMPTGIVLPDGHSVIQDAELGMGTHLLQVSVPNDPSSELPGWKSALEDAGYQVNDGMLADGRLLFEGGNVESGQISVSQPEDVEGYMIQIDVSTNAQ